MPGASDVPSVWRGRNLLYRVSLLALMAGLPLHLLAIVLPFWLEFQYRPQEDEEVPASLGLWQVCLLSQCYSLTSVEAKPVGTWLTSVKILMLCAFVLHSVAVVVGSVQNFLSRRRIGEWSSVLCRRLVHRDSEVTEDVGFLAGFFGQAAHIVFILCIKEELSDGAQLSWGFGFGFLATGTAALSSLALTKAHARPSPRLPAPPSSPSASPLPLGDVGGAEAGASGERGTAERSRSRGLRDDRLRHERRETVGYL